MAEIEIQYLKILWPRVVSYTHQSRKQTEAGACFVQQ